MKIGIDISQVVYGTGVSKYTKNLIENLLIQDTGNQYVLFGGTARREADLKKFTGSLKGKFTEKIIFFPPNLADLIWNRLHLLKIENFIGRVEVFHCSDWTSPPTEAFKITTVHDLSPLRFPKLTNPKIVSVHKAVLKWIAKEADRVIVPSLATKEDLVLLKINRNKIRVIPEASDPYFHKVGKEEIAQVKKLYNISSDYLLSVGVGERKNTQRIIEAYKMLGLDKWDLVFSGRHEGWENTSDRIKFLGYVNDHDLRALYSGAQALIYPSVYEGFGLPILEAFSCLSPVVTSNLSSMPEVAGEAAVLVDPFSVTSISNGIMRAIKERQYLIKKGLRRTLEFTWEKTARETLKVYREVVS